HTPASVGCVATTTVLISSRQSGPALRQSRTCRASATRVTATASARSVRASHTGGGEGERASTARMLALRAMDVRQAFRSELGLLGAVVVGAAIRLDQIREQIVLDDEWHALHAILRFGYGRILTHFGWTDVCIPLAVFDKVVADTVGLSEMWMRLPVLLAGIVSLLVLPLMLRRWVGRAAGTSLAWLLAVSPLHVFFSRFARPYAISLLLVMGGGLALARWWEDGRPQWKTVGIAGFVLGPYFHLSVLPAV